ncbi:hypothetical protein FACS1894137_07220 [Spirochaetia bacterium]|nr:hypothetical protein FACS1894137_07220 [Spirochaetia bacterium]
MKDTYGSKLEATPNALSVDDASEKTLVIPKHQGFALVRRVTKVRETFRGLSLVKPSLLVNQTAPATPANQPQDRLPNPNADDYNTAMFNLVTQGLGRWSRETPYSPEKTILLDEINRFFSKVLHFSLPQEDAYAITTYDCDTIIAVIRRLRKKVGITELAVMMLIAKIAIEKMYVNIGCRSDSEFISRNAEAMGISISRAWDYYKRGKAFFNYGNHIIHGTGLFTGIPLDEFVASHMSKLTLLDRAVKIFGEEKALENLKALTFREFQKILTDKKFPRVDSSNSHTEHQPKDTVSQKPLDIHAEQKTEILSPNLRPNEERLLRIIAKRGKYCTITGLTDEQIIEVEARLRQYRQDVYERNLQVAPCSYKRPPFDPNTPLEFSENLANLKNVNDIILRIRAGLALVVPARRVIAFLVFRLYSEIVDGKPQWKRPYEGVTYTSFRDFAINVLGLGEDYRDYVAVGKVLKNYYYFLESLSDMDTEDVFFKLRYLPEALKIHKDEPLVLTRLRSLTIREFKCFSEEPDFEITFSKKLTKKQIDLFHEALFCTRDPLGFIGNTSIDFIEVYHQTENGTVQNIVSAVLAGSGIRSEGEISIAKDTGITDSIGDALAGGGHSGDEPPIGDTSLLTSPAA